MVICLERGADLHMAQLMPLPPALSCFSKILIGFTFLVPAHPGSTGKRAVKQVCVYLACSYPQEVLYILACWFFLILINFYPTVIMFWLSRELRSVFMSH